MVEMELHKIVIDEKRHDQLIVLKEKDGSYAAYYKIQAIPTPLANDRQNTKSDHFLKNAPSHHPG